MKKTIFLVILVSVLFVACNQPEGAPLIYRWNVDIVASSGPGGYVITNQNDFPVTIELVWVDDAETVLWAKTFNPGQSYREYLTCQHRLYIKSGGQTIGVINMADFLL